jgi:hypothetical protein
VTFGGPAGTPYVLLVASVTEEGEQAILKWLKDGEDTGKFPGWTVLPQGTTPHARVNVTR